MVDAHGFSFCGFILRSGRACRMGGVVIGKRAGLLASRFFLTSDGKSRKDKNGDPDRSSV